MKMIQPQREVQSPLRDLKRNLEKKEDFLQTFFCMLTHYNFCFMYTMTYLLCASLQFYYEEKE